MYFFRNLDVNALIYYLGSTTCILFLILLYLKLGRDKDQNCNYFSLSFCKLKKF